MVTGPRNYTLDFFDLTKGVPVIRNFTTASFSYHYYKWFNWGHKDFRVLVEGFTGEVYFFFNLLGEETYVNTGYLSVPQTLNNSRYSVLVNTSETNTLRIFKTDLANGFFCYYCWYYISIYSNYTRGPSSYRLTIFEVPDSGEEIP